MRLAVGLTVGLSGMACSQVFGLGQAQPLLDGAGVGSVFGFFVHVVFVNTFFEGAECQGGAGWTGHDQFAAQLFDEVFKGHGFNFFGGHALGDFGDVGCCGAADGAAFAFPVDGLKFAVFVDASVHGDDVCAARVAPGEADVGVV